MVPGPRSKLGAPCSNLRYFGSKCTVLKKVLVTLLGLFRALCIQSVSGKWCSPSHPRYAPDPVPHAKIMFQTALLCRTNLYTLSFSRVSYLIRRFWDQKIDGANYFGYVPTASDMRGFCTVFYDVPYPQVRYALRRGNAFYLVLF